MCSNLRSCAKSLKEQVLTNYQQLAGMHAGLQIEEPDERWALNTG